MIALDVVSIGVDIVSDGWCVVIFSKGLKMPIFSIMKPSFSFQNCSGTFENVCWVA